MLTLIMWGTGMKRIIITIQGVQNTFLFIYSNSKGTYGSDGGTVGMEGRFDWSGEISTSKGFIFIRFHKLKILQQPTKIDSVVFNKSWNPSGGPPTITYSSMKMVLSSGTFFKLRL